jgi:hypothetical protein
MVSEEQHEEKRKERRGEEGRRIHAASWPLVARNGSRIVEDIDSCEKFRGNAVGITLLPLLHSGRVPFLPPTSWRPRASGSDCPGRRLIRHEAAALRPPPHLTR